MFDGRRSAGRKKHGTFLAAKRYRTHYTKQVIPSMVQKKLYDVWQVWTAFDLVGASSSRSSQDINSCKGGCLKNTHSLRNLENIITLYIVRFKRRSLRALCFDFWGLSQLKYELCERPYTSHYRFATLTCYTSKRILAKWWSRWSAPN